jgi:stage V sporulation protein AD
MLQGHQSWVFERPPVILATATVVGPDEGNGPLHDQFDIVHGDKMLGQDSWEKAERVLFEEAAQEAIDKAGLTNGQVQFFIGGDLMNQIITSTFTARTLSIPLLGIFGACSTSMEGLALAALLLDTHSANYILTGTCSHNCTVEKQFRYPTEYGSQKPPTAQYTVTGAGCAVLGKLGEGPRVTSATIGRVIDMGISDPFNMGAAMAPAAVDTIQAHFRDMNRSPRDYDMIITGDLGAVGYAIATQLMVDHAMDMHLTSYMDCGMIIYDREKQQVQAGGSGCGCSAVVTYGHFLKRLMKGEFKRMLVVATGALLSPLSYQQGETIPCIAHAVAIEAGGERS